MKIYGIHVSALTCYNINRLFPGGSSQGGYACMSILRLPQGL